MLYVPSLETGNSPKISSSTTTENFNNSFQYKHFRLNNGTENIRRRKSVKRVSKACTNCSRAHTACDRRRPCSRCIRKGTEVSCTDVSQKKRGRKKTFRTQKTTIKKPEDTFSMSNLFPETNLIQENDLSSNNSDSSSETIIGTNEYHNNHNQNNQNKKNVNNNKNNKNYNNNKNNNKNTQTRETAPLSYHALNQIQDLIASDSIQIQPFQNSNFNSSSSSLSSSLKSKSRSPSTNTNSSSSTSSLSSPSFPLTLSSSSSSSSSLSSFSNSENLSDFLPDNNTNDNNNNINNNNNTKNNNNITNIYISNGNYVENTDLHQMIRNTIDHISLNFQNNLARFNTGMFISNSIPHISTASRSIATRWAYENRRDSPQTWFDFLHPAAQTGASADLAMIQSDKMRNLIAQNIYKSRSLSQDENASKKSATIDLGSGSSTPGAAFEKKIIDHVLKVKARTIGQDKKGFVFEYIRECYIIYSKKSPHYPKQVISYMFW